MVLRRWAQLIESEERRDVRHRPDQAKKRVERLDHNDLRRPPRPGFDRRAFLRRTALTGVAAGSVSTILARVRVERVERRAAAAPNVFGSHPSYKFVFVNHVTTNPFFVPTQYGAADACKLLGCSYQWTGSESSNVNQMVNAMNTAITSGADGIAVALIDLHAFNAPIEAALKAGIPVVAYNADAPGNKRLAYIGQDLKKAGEQMGERIVAAVGSGDVALFIATPGSANLQPRIEGAEKAIKALGQADHDRTRSRRARRCRESYRRSTPTGSATRTRRACTRSTAAARKASRK